jgi:hypothetical protein
MRLIFREVETLADVPDTQYPGTIYFVKEEKVIVVDHADGRIEY